MKKGHLALALLLTASSAFAQPPTKVEKLSIAVLDLDARGIEQGLVGAISDRVRHEFWTYKDFDLVAREKMEQLAKEKGYQLTGCTDITCAVKIGNALNVKKMIVGSVGRLGPQKYQVFLQAIDVEKENVVCSELEEGEVKEEDISSLVPLAVQKVSACLLGKATPEISLLKQETGALRVYSTPAGAKVFVEGKDSGLTPLLVSPLKMGSYQVVIVKEGYKNYTAQVNVNKGDTILLKALLSKVVVFSPKLKRNFLEIGVGIDGVAKRGPGGPVFSMTWGRYMMKSWTLSLQVDYFLGNDSNQSSTPYSTSSYEENYKYLPLSIGITKSLFLNKVEPYIEVRYGGGWSFENWQVRGTNSFDNPPTTIEYSGSGTKFTGTIRAGGGIRLKVTGNMLLNISGYFNQNSTGTSRGLMSSGGFFDGGFGFVY